MYICVCVCVCVCVCLYVCMYVCVCAGADLVIYNNTITTVSVLLCLTIILLARSLALVYS